MLLALGYLTQWLDMTEIPVSQGSYDSLGDWSAKQRILDSVKGGYDCRHPLGRLIT